MCVNNTFLFNVYLQDVVVVVFWKRVLLIVTGALTFDLHVLPTNKQEVNCVKLKHNNI